MTLVQQITFLTFPLAALIAMFGGWCAYQLSLKHVRIEDDFNRIFLQVMVVGCEIGRASCRERVRL